MKSKGLYLYTGKLKTMKVYHGMRIQTRGKVSQLQRRTMISTRTGWDAIFNYVLSQFNLTDSVYAFAKYTPGLILPWHRDNYPTYARNKKAKVEEIVRIMIFLHDPAPGHQLWIEDQFCTGPAGSWFAWQGATKHMAANLGETERYVIQITGKIPK
jgi:hypothetical protein